MSTVVQWRRVTIVDGAERREILVSTQKALSDSLRNEGIDVATRSVVVIAADGSRLDVAVVPTIQDGALLTLVEPQPAGTSPVRRERAVTGRQDFTTVLWAVASIVAVVVALVAALSPTASGFGSPVQDQAGASAAIALRYGAVVLLALLAITAVVTTTARRDAAAGNPGVSLVVPALLGFSSGFLAIPSGLTASVHLAIFSGLAAAALAQAGVHLRTVGTIGGGASGLVTVTIAVLAAAFGLTLVLGFDASVAAALVAGAAPVALRVLPTVCLDIPEGQLLEYSEFMRNRWTVRGPIPQHSHPVTAVELRPTMTRARVQFRAGTVLFSLIPAVTVPMILLAPGTGPVSGIGTIVLVCTVLVSFLLSPRRANTPLLRWTPRVGAAVVALEFTLIVGLREPGVLGIIFAGASLIAALIVASTMVPLARGMRSLGISRTADIFENLATAFSFPAAFVAASMIDILRGAVS